MPRYRIVLTPSAERAFLALAPDVRARLDAPLLALQDQPRPAGVKALVGVKGVYRLRVGDYRILYEIHDAAVYVLVLAVGHRREVYRRRR